MKLLWYPSYLENDPDASVKEFIQKDLAKQKDIRLLIEKFLVGIERMQDLQPLFDTKQLAPIGDGVFEMRIPKEGVVGLRVFITVMAGIHKIRLFSSMLNSSMRRQREGQKLRTGV